VAPYFLRSVSQWPAKYSSLFQHFVAFRTTLERHVSFATALVTIGDKLLIQPIPDVCTALLDRWKATNIVGFEDITLNAIFLHLACVLHPDGSGSGLCLSNVLGRICSLKTGIDALACTVLSLGSLERIEVRNFPLCYFDAFTPSDSQRSYDEAQQFYPMIVALRDKDAAFHNDVSVLGAACALKPLSPSGSANVERCGRRWLGTSSHERIQNALAAKKHFCFKPSNPNNQGEDGVVFLREERTEDLKWTVLLIQNEYWFHGERLSGESVVDVWRSGVWHLPSTVTCTRCAT
jgi:hypothetical protein